MRLREEAPLGGGDGVLWNLDWSDLDIGGGLGRHYGYMIEVGLGIWSVATTLLEPLFLYLNPGRGLGVCSKTVKERAYG